MILYLDTSALVKLYVPEKDSDKIIQLADAVEMPSTSRVTYTEARAAFARKRRERAVNLRDYRTIVEDLDNDWVSFFIVDVSDALIKRAGQLAETFALGGYEAVHLASAVIVAAQGSQAVMFACFVPCRATARPYCVVVMLQIPNAGNVERGFSNLRCGLECLRSSRFPGRVCRDCVISAFSKTLRRQWL